MYFHSHCHGQGHLPLDQAGSKPCPVIEGGWLNFEMKTSIDAHVCGKVTHVKKAQSLILESQWWLWINHCHSVLRSWRCATCDEDVNLICSSNAKDKVGVTGIKGLESKPKGFFCAYPALCAVSSISLPKDVVEWNREGMGQCWGSVKQCRSVWYEKIKITVVLPGDLRLLHMSLVVMLLWFPPWVGQWEKKTRPCACKLFTVSCSSLKFSFS